MFKRDIHDNFKPEMVLTQICMHVTSVLVVVVKVHHSKQIVDSHSKNVLLSRC